MAAPKGHKRYGGRKKGEPNKVTVDVRAAFAGLLESNASKLSGWLARVAKDDPGRALDIVTRLAEYHIPKLSRAEVTGENGKPLEVTIVRYSDAPPK